MINRRNFIKGTVAGIFAAGAFDVTGLFPEQKVIAAENLSVKTRYGTFNGFTDTKGVKTWLGIPYAKPPVKNLRWQPPQKLNPTNKTFDAKKFGYVEVQVVDENEGASTSPQSEDCLTLNIWKKSDKKNLPVMVFVHGGAFVGGGSNDPLYYGSNFVSANDVILVTFNYRINVFGFVNFGAIDKNFEGTGYLGIQDQVAALEWIKENISEFGGNPDNVTVFGESAGAISTMLLTVAPAAKKFFQKAIPQSANSYMYTTPEYSAKVAETFMEMGNAKNMQDMLKKSSDEMRELFHKVRDARISEAIKDYLPICDGKYLPKNPFKALKDGDARGIKILTGTTATEWRYWFAYFDNFFEIFRAEPTNFSPVLQKYTAQSPQEIYKKWLKNRIDTIENFEDFVNNLDWRVGQELAAEYNSIKLGGICDKWKSG